MTKFTQADIITNPSSVINYYLVNMNFYQSDIKTESATEGRYHISYTQPTTNTNDNNVVYYNHTTSQNEFYNVTDVYFNNLIHDNIAGKTDGGGPGYINNLIGELIFETTNIIGGTKKSGNTKLFLCFLIKNAGGGNGEKPGPGTDDLKGTGTGSIAKLFNNIISGGGGNIVYGNSGKGTTTISPSADGTIPKQTECIIYLDRVKNATVVVYLNPISISVADEVSFVFGLNYIGSSPIVNNYPLEPTDVLTAGTTGKGIVDMSSNPFYSENSQIYIDCNPTGASESSITTYNLPINSDLMSDIQNSSFAKLCSNFALFGIMLLAAYIGVPKLYNLAVCEKMEGDNIMYAKSFIIFFLLIVSLSLFANGNQNGNIIEMMAGFFIIFLTIVTYILISNEELAANRSFSNFNMIDFITFIGGVIGFLFEKCLAPIFVLWVILLIILVILTYAAKKDNGDPAITSTQFRDIMLWVGLVAIPTMVGILIQIST
jgi:hypothetical protein